VKTAYACRQALEGIEASAMTTESVSYAIAVVIMLVWLLAVRFAKPEIAQQIGPVAVLAATYLFTRPVIQAQTRKRNGNGNGGDRNAKKTEDVSDG
jgi:hypothetical protein